MLTRLSIARGLVPVLAGLLLATAPGAVGAAVVDTPYGESRLPFELHKVPDAPVYYVVGHAGVPGADNEGHTSNAGFVVTEEGVVVFDALGTPALGYRLIQGIREVTGQRIDRIIVSHYHADHIYGLQAFAEHANGPPVWAQHAALGYLGGSAATQGEDAARRLRQRREALFPWVDEDTWIVTPDHTFGQSLDFQVGGVGFEVRHLGPAHAPGDSVMLVRDFGVLFSGDVIYRGRIPFLDSPQTDIDHWLAELDSLAREKPTPNFVIPGHGRATGDVEEAVTATRDYIRYVRRMMRRAVADFISFDQAYREADWSRYDDMPAFDASNRGNAYRIFLEMEAQSFEWPATIDGTAPAAPARDADQRIAEAVSRVLNNDSNTRIQDLRVVVEDGIATLHGRVARSADKHLAGRYAEDVRGVVGVVNAIDVQPPAPDPGAPMKGD